MKMKKILVLSILMIMMLIFFTGCSSYNITKEVKQIQTIAEKVIEEENYEVPREYLINKILYTDNNNNKDSMHFHEAICIDNVIKGIEIIFKTSEVTPKIQEICFLKRNSFSKVIYKVQISEFESICDNVLNGIEIPENYSASVNKQKIKVSEKQYDGTIRVTFDISKDTLEIVDVEFCSYENSEILKVILIILSMILFGICLYYLIRNIKKR